MCIENWGKGKKISTDTDCDRFGATDRAQLLWSQLIPCQAAGLDEIVVVAVSRIVEIVTLEVGPQPLDRIQLRAVGAK